MLHTAFLDENLKHPRSLVNCNQWSHLTLHQSKALQSSPWLCDKFDIFARCTAFISLHGAPVSRRSLKTSCFISVKRSASSANGTRTYASDAGIPWWSMHYSQISSVDGKCIFVCVMCRLRCWDISKLVQCRIHVPKFIVTIRARKITE